MSIMIFRINVHQDNEYEIEIVRDKPKWLNKYFNLPHHLRLTSVNLELEQIWIRSFRSFVCVFCFSPECLCICRTQKSCANKSQCLKNETKRTRRRGKKSVQTRKQKNASREMALLLPPLDDRRVIRFSGSLCFAVEFCVWTFFYLYDKFFLKSQYMHDSAGIEKFHFCLRLTGNERAIDRCQEVNQLCIR